VVLIVGFVFMSSKVAFTNLVLTNKRKQTFNNTERWCESVCSDFLITDVLVTDIKRYYLL